MQVFESVFELKNHLSVRAETSCVSIGNFDGVHLGHQELIKQLNEKKQSFDQQKTKSVVISFYPHPVQVLYPERGFTKIFDLEDQLQQMQKLGVDYFVKQAFSRELSNLSPEQFIGEYIVKSLSPKALVVGYDFNFGAKRAGGIEFLQQAATRFSFELIVVPAFKLNDEIVSSSKIRQFIMSSQIEKANAFLGRSYYLKGIVERGAGRGKGIGIPTANLFSQSECVPAKGVYKSLCYLGDKVYKSISNIGNNPTFNHATSKIYIETHIFDFQEDIYGSNIRIELLNYIRAEKKFDSVKELIDQIQKDLQVARNDNT